MYISRVIVKHYRCLEAADVTFNHDLNIVVGDNECGKSTLLEAINLALTGQLNGRPIQVELHPHLFTATAVTNYINALKRKEAVAPPEISIEVYLHDDPLVAHLKGINNSKNIDAPGVVLSIAFDTGYASEFASYVRDPALIRTLPIEYYTALWRDFADNPITGRSIPTRLAFIDASTIRNNMAANRYVVDIIRNSLTRSQKVDLALSYRMMKDAFLDDPKVAGVNATLKTKQGEISDKALSVSLDTSSRANWEAGVMPHLDEIPITLIGKGEQNTVKIKLAMESADDSHLIMIEEAENHLSFANLNALIGHIADRRGKRQLIITTHSSFVLNKLGIESVVLFNRGRSIRLNNLTSGTQDYFMRLPGHDTLRLILARRSILVEGPSDELIVQAAYHKQHGMMPLEAGIDVIAVNSLAFKRFLEIAALLNREVAVVTDNDGNVSALRQKYADYLNSPSIRILYDPDENYRTLEPQLLKANGRGTIQTVLGRNFVDDNELLAYMRGNKADVALKFFLTTVPWTAPKYIVDAVA